LTQPWLAQARAFRKTDTGLVLFLRVTPNASRDCIDGAKERDDGTLVLRVHVRAVPDKGKANKAVIAILAKSLGVPKTTLRLLHGETARFKTIAIEGNSEFLARKAQSLS